MATLEEVLQVINEKVPANPVQRIGADATNEALVEIAKFAGESVAPVFSNDSIYI